MFTVLTYGAAEHKNQRLATATYTALCTHNRLSRFNFFVLLASETRTYASCHILHRTITMFTVFCGAQSVTADTYLYDEEPVGTLGVLDGCGWVQKKGLYVVNTATTSSSRCLKSNILTASKTTQPRTRAKWFRIIQHRVVAKAKGGIFCARKRK